MRRLFLLIVIPCDIIFVLMYFFAAFERDSLQRLAVFCYIVQPFLRRFDASIILLTATN